VKALQYQKSAQVQAPRPTFPRKLYFFYERNTGVSPFHVVAGPDGQFPMEQAAGLLAMHCMVGGQTPLEYLKLRAPGKPPAALPKVAAGQAVVTYQNGQLTIEANNASLIDVLRAVCKQIGAELDSQMVADERVFNVLGPGPSREVLGALLSNSHFNYAMAESPSDPNTLASVVVFPKTKGSTQQGTGDSGEQNRGAQAQAGSTDPKASAVEKDSGLKQIKELLATAKVEAAGGAVIETPGEDGVVQVDAAAILQQVEAQLNAAADAAAADGNSAQTGQPAPVEPNPNSGASHGGIGEDIRIGRKTALVRRAVLCPRHRRGSSRVVRLPKKFLELVPGGRIFGLVLATLLVVGASASAGDLAGRVTNGTTKKPAAGDEVVLLTSSNGGMKESARAKTDSAGHFNLTVGDTRGSYVVRVLHQGVTYEKIAEPNSTLVAIQVYNVADKLDGLSAVMDVQRFEARNDRLEVKQLVTMHNASKPPRTLMNDRPFSIQLPANAQVLSGLVLLGDGEPLKGKPAPGERKDEYYFRSPLRPGDTRFAIVYRLPYNGEAVVEPTIRNAQERFVVMLPKSMTFQAQAGGIFQAMLNVTQDNVQGTAPVTLGQTLAFRISGTGTLAELQGREQPSRSDSVQPAGQPDLGFHASPGTSGRDKLILGGLGVVLLVFSVVLIAKTRRQVPPSVEPEVLLVQSRRSQKKGRRKRRVRVSQQYSH